MKPGGLRAAARQFNSLAIEVDGAASSVRGLPGQMASWSGPASARFAGACADHAAAAGAGVSALTSAGLVAARYAQALDEAQDDARAAIEDAREATRRIRALEQAIEDARARQAAAQDRAATAAMAINAASATGTPNPAAEADLYAAQSAAADASADIVGLERRLEDARDDLRRAKERGRRAEEAAEQAGEAAAGGFAALGDCVLFVGAPAAAAAAAVGAGGVPPMYPPRRPGGFAMSDAASGGGYRTHGDPLRFHRQWEAEQEAQRAAEEAEEDDGGGLFSDIVHGGLDVVGLVPVLGEPADLPNAGIYLAEGDKLNAGLSAGGAIPFVGMAATGAKWGKRAYDAADTFSDAARHAPTYPPSTYTRPSGYRAGVRPQVWDNAREPATGQVRDPVTGRFMSPDQPWDMGHRPGYEFRKHADSAEQRQISREQFLDEHNNPSHYRPELPGPNRSHRGEDASDDFLGP